MIRTLLDGSRYSRSPGDTTVGDYRLMRVLGGQLGWFDGSRTEVAVSTARREINAPWSMKGEEADPRSFPPKALPHGPLVSASQQLLLVHEDAEQRLLTVIVAVRLSCQDQRASRTTWCGELLPDTFLPCCLRDHVISDASFRRVVGWTGGLPGYVD